VLLRGPHAAQVDRVDPVEVFGRLVGGIGGRGLHAGVVEGHVESSVGLHGAVDRSGNLRLVGDVAVDADRLVPSIRERSRGLLHGGGVAVEERHGGSTLGEGARCRQSHAGGRAGNQGDLAGEVVRRVGHRGFPLSRPLRRAGPVPIQP
jgi:hypothetical protein